MGRSMEGLGRAGEGLSVPSGRKWNISLQGQEVLKDLVVSEKDMPRTEPEDC